MAVQSSRSKLSLLRSYFIATTPLLISILVLLCFEKSSYYGETLLIAWLANLAVIPVLFLFWYSKLDCGIPLLITCISCGLLAIIAFFVSFFIVFYSISQHGLEQIHEPCTIVNSTAIIDIGNGMESYQVLSVEFSYEGETMLGAACFSSLAEEVADGQYPSFKFLYRGDSISQYKARRNLIDNLAFKVQTILENNSEQEDPDGEHSQIRNLAKKKKKNSSSSAGKKNNVISNRYNNTQVKIASWLCSPDEGSELSQVQPECYVTFFGNEDEAKKNAIQKTDLLNANSFALITFTRVPFPNSYLLILFTFTIVPFFCSLIAFTSMIEKRFSDFISDYVKNIFSTLSKWKKGRLQTHQPVQLQQNQVELFHTKSNAASSVPTAFICEKLECVEMGIQYPMQTFEGKVIQEGQPIEDHDDSTFLDQKNSDLKIKKSFSNAIQCQEKSDAKRDQEKRKSSF